MSNFIKKSFTWGVVVSTMVWAMGIATFSFTASAAQDGDRIKMAGNTAVYWLLSGKRYVFPHEKTYFTWFSDFSGVVTISQTELQSYAIGGNVTYRPGTRWVKITTDPKTYMVEPGGKLRWVTSEAIAVSLGGPNWNKKIDDVSDAFFVNYTSGADLTSAQYPVGTLVKEESSSTLYYIAEGMTKRAFASDAAFSANRYKMGDVLTAAAGGLASYSAGSSFTGKEDAIANYGGMAGGGPTAAGGTLSLMLSSTTPASGTAVKGALIPFTVIDATCTGGDCVIDSIVGQRGGIAQDTVFSDISVLVDGTQVGLDKTLNSTHQFTLFDDITVPSGQTKKIMLRGNTASSLSSNVGETPTLGLVAATMKQGNLSAALPIYGNPMTANNSVSIGTVTVAAGSLNPSASTQKIGTKNYVLAEVQLTVGSAEDVQLEEILWDQAGSADDSDISNVQLVSDGVVLATMEHPVNKKAHFKLNPAVKIEKGKNKSYAIRANLDSGSNRTVDFDIEKDSDLIVKGLTYGYNILAGTWPASSDPRFNGVVTTIDTGTIKVEPVATPSNKIAEGADDQVLGMFNFEAKGEEVQITKLGIQIATVGSGATPATTSDVTNVTLYDEAGVAVAGPKDPTYDTGSGLTSYGSATTTDTIMVPVGVHKYTVKATLSSDFAAGNTVFVNITPGANITAKGAETGKTITATPATVQTSTTQTIQVGSLVASVQTSPTAQTVVAGTNGFTFANLVLDAQSSGEDLRVTQLKAAQHTTGSAYPALISGLKLYDGSTELTTSNDPDPTSTTAAASATSTFTFVNAVVVPKGTSKTVTLKGNISKSVTSGTVAFGMQMDATNAVSATGVDTGNSITPTYNYSDGQSMTLTSAGTLSLAADASTPIAGLLPANTTGLAVAVIGASAQYEKVQIEKLYVSVTDVNSAGGPDQFDKIWLTDGTKTVGVTPTSSDSATSPTTILFDMSLDPFEVAAGASKLFTLKVDTSNVDLSNSSKGSSGQGFQLSVNATGDVTAKGAQSGATASVSGTPTFNAFTLYRSVPTFAPVALSNSFGGGLRELSKFTISADPKGPLGVYKFSFAISTSSISYVRDFYVNDSSYSAGPITAIQAHDTSVTSNPDYLDFLFDTDNSGTAQGGELREIPAGGSRTFTLFGTVTDDGTAGGSVSVSLLGDDAFPSTVMNCAGTTTSGGNTCTGVDSSVDDDFIWSDFSYTTQYNSSTATNTLMWTNGFRVKNLLTTSTPQSL